MIASTSSAMSSNVKKRLTKDSMMRLKAKFNGQIVYTKPIDQNPMTDADTRNTLRPHTIQHLLKLYALKHENLTKFMAIYQSSADLNHNFVFIWEFCSRGSLGDVINNIDIKLDWTFKASFLGDLIRGMKYLHNSLIQTHGYLNSQNCVIDSRWLLKVTNFGINRFRELQSLEISDSHDANELLWFAPELLRNNDPFLKGSQEADVYSFAIIIQEIVVRDKPYSTYANHLSTMDIIARIK
ncbi:unnamed protein product, partial [Medioppia subpectinata]